ncbi:molybdate transport system regulatory protein [Proteiniborus ethanoligenes]|uniref:Molybdate transport system regulatory protein n=1 Tax=Proteiniborus ethanoligenes TaxID=415015 RepID=A0A1H3NS16_9FIRM|nr:LysR family transcriptional regulator [Proteiniborus ethanoligenes]SDY91480.1 molybdate transport system regulatory protein [Proteiniborus ethanoligenes]
MNLGWRIWLSKEDSRIFGKGPKELLLRTESMGSLRKAAMSMNMSYSKAWNLISNLEKALEIRILDKTIGGIDGGSSTLTQEGKELIRKYEELEKRVEEAVLKIYEEIF